MKRRDLCLKLNHLNLNLEGQVVTLIDEISLRKKLEGLWLRVGEKCTKFFPQGANLHERSNAIGMMVVDDIVSSNQSTINLMSSA